MCLSENVLATKRLFQVGWRQIYGLLGLLVFLSFSACTDDPTFSEDSAVAAPEIITKKASDNSFIKSNNSQDVLTKLGKKRKNPFTIPALKAAGVSLYGNNYPTKVPTHGYVKFKPTSIDHLMILEDWQTTHNVALFDFPLEYKIVTMGDYYVDPAATEPYLTPQYTTVPVGTPIPNVPYELIDAIYLDKSDPLLLAESFRLTDNKDEIEEYFGFVKDLNAAVLPGVPTSAIPVPPTCPAGCRAELQIDETTVPISLKWVCDCTPPPPPPLNACNCPIPSNPRHAAGCIRVANGANMDGVQKATVRVYDGFLDWNRVKTDEMGCYHVAKRHSGRVWTKVIFKNENVKVKDRRYWSFLRTVRDQAGRKNGPPYTDHLIDYGASMNDNTSNNRMYWAAALTLNAVNTYRNEAVLDGIPLPRQGLNWFNSAGDGAASAAMLQGNVFSAWPAFLALSIFPGPAYPLSVSALPDITNPYEEMETAEEYLGTAFHELGHASHYSLVGEQYWYPYRNHIVNNSGYGVFPNFNSGSNPNHVALGEAVGNYIGNLYGGVADGGENNEWENNFIPRGLLFDLTDDSPFDVVNDINVPGLAIFDDVSGFTPEMYFNSLVPNITSIRAFRDRLRILHLADTPNNATDYNDLVDIYDVFN